MRGEGSRHHCYEKSAKITNVTLLMLITFGYCTAFFYFLYIKHHFRGEPFYFQK
jgi:hypothetical protein